MAQDSSAKRTLEETVMAIVSKKLKETLDGIHLDYLGADGCPPRSPKPTTACDEEDNDDREEQAARYQEYRMDVILTALAATILKCPKCGEQKEG